MGPDQFFEALAALPNYRSATVNDLEITRQNKGFRFRGHAAVFGEEAVIDEIPGIGVVTESIARGAFDNVLQQDANIPFTLEHDPTKVYATTRSGLLHLAPDTKGLEVDAELPPTTMAKDLHELVNAGVITGMSFGFVAGKGNQTVERRSNGRHRTLTGFKKLLDVCATWDPTYRSAEAQFRSLTMQYADSPESWQQLLMGVYPQLGEQGDDNADTADEAGTDEPDDASDQGEPDGAAEPGAGEDEDPGVIEQRNHLSVAARRRRLQFFDLTHGGL